jgi:CheY-like chemotaxis protein
MVRLIDDLLDVARVSGDKLELQRHRIDIADAVRDAVETSQSLIHEARHTLTVMLPTQPVLVDADATRLCQVITNLLNNAAKYTSEGGHIRLSVEPSEPGWVEVCVEDDGRGLAPEMLPQVFQMFTQVDRQAGRSGGGLGIGLAIARKLTQMHGGDLHAASGGLGHGSSFVVRLPRASADIADAPPASSFDMQVLVADRQGQLRAGCRVLIADDNADAADSLNTLLRLMGCATWVAGDGVEALRLADSMRPDIGLLDIGMPGLNGHQLARQIRAQPWGRAIKLVAVTGWGQASDQQASADAGFDLHWVKPVDPAALDALIEGVAAARAATAAPGA